MNFKKNIVATITLAALLFFSSCQKAAPAQAEDAAEIPVSAEHQEEDSRTSEQSAAEITCSGDLIPDGVLINTDDNGVGLTYLDIHGHVLSEIDTPGIGNAIPENVFIAGTVIPNQPLPPVIYRSWEPELALMANTNGSISTVRQTQSFLSLVGAPGQSVLAFSEVIISPNNFPHSFLYLGNTANLGTIGSFVDTIDELAYMALMPVGVEATNGEPHGVWYTKTGWGIGRADLIFPINRGLYFFDLTTGENLQMISADRGFQGISPDLSLAGIVEYNVVGSQVMTVINLINSQQTSFTLNSASDRGAGCVVFSPNNRFVAWLEASGSMISDPPDFLPRIRIGDLQNEWGVKDLMNAAAAQAINSSRITFMRPVGWLDNETLLIEVRGQDWNDVSLLRLDVMSAVSSVFSSGIFVGFGYQSSLQNE